MKNLLMVGQDVWACTSPNGTPVWLPAVVVYKHNGRDPDAYEIKFSHPRYSDGTRSYGRCLIRTDEEHARINLML